MHLFFVTDDPEKMKVMSAWRPTHQFQKWVLFASEGNLMLLISPDDGDNVYHADIYQSLAQALRMQIDFQPILLDQDSRVQAYYDTRGFSLLEKVNDNCYAFDHDEFLKSPLVVLGGGRIRSAGKSIMVYDKSATFQLPSILQQDINCDVAEFLSRFLENVISDQAIQIGRYGQCCNDLGAAGGCTDEIIISANKDLQVGRNVRLKMFDGQKSVVRPGALQYSKILIFQPQDGEITVERIKKLVGGQYQDNTFQPSGYDDFVMSIIKMAEAGELSSEEKTKEKSTNQKEKKGPKITIVRVTDASVGNGISATEVIRKIKNKEL